jgi:thymidine phosphorylase
MDSMTATCASSRAARSHTRAYLRTKRLGLHTQREPVVIVRSDCPVCRSEGLSPREQVLLRTDGREVTAILFQHDGDLLEAGEIGLSEAAWSLLGSTEGERVEISHAPALESLSAVRRRIYGQPLDEAAMDAIVVDIVAGRYSDVHLAAFLTAGSALPLSDQETTALTGSMARSGDRLSWGAGKIVDKHSVGGLPGNRTTPIIVAIAAACGLTIPKTSSRAITSPAGTADAMDTVTKVDLNVAAIRRVVEAEGGCLAWGGAVNLSPADDIFIGVERQLDIDTEGQLIASVLSKKIASGATHLVLDIPVGPTAKVRGPEAAARLAARLTETAARFGIEALCIQSDGTQPVGRSIGPALEMMDVLAVLRCQPAAPADLRDRSLTLAAALLEIGGAAAAGEGLRLARSTLASGAAYRKFERICRAQGEFREPPRARRQRIIPSAKAGRVRSIDNRKISRLAKLAGAPDWPAAGLQIHVRIGDEVAEGQTLVTLHAGTDAELRYPLAYAAANPDIVAIEP